MTRPTFTDEQLAVIAHEEGHSIVSAVPGAGKSTTLRARLKRLAGVHPAGYLLAVMFNKAAQLEFDAKLKLSLGSHDAPDVRTFHSIGFRMMKELTNVGELSPAKLISSGRVLDAAARAALKQSWRVAYGQAAFISPEQMEGFVQFLTLAKSTLASARAVFARSTFSPECRPFIDAFGLFEEQREKQRRVYFDDLIYRPMRLLRNRPDLWQMFADRYEHILVDEFQDVSPIQFDMIRGLAGHRASVQAVGDENQSIYQFRGAQVRLMSHRFEDQFTPCTRYPMTRTFRFGHELALAANHLIAHNRERNQSLVISPPENPDTRVERVAMAPKQPSGICEILEPYAAAGRLRDAVVLVRNFSHAITFELELLQGHVPFFVYGRQPLLFVPEVAAMVCALSLATNHWIIEPEDRIFFLASLLGVPTMYAQRELLEGIAQRMDTTVTAADSSTAADALVEAARTLSRTDGRLGRRLSERADAVRLLCSGSMRDQPPATILQVYARMTGLLDNVAKGASTPTQADEATGTITAFMAMAERSTSTTDFLELLGPLAAMEEEKPPKEDHVALTTLHRSKGREWPLVVLAGLAAGAFPNLRPDTDVEEERRLAYVGMTRAKHRLILFHPADPHLAAREANLALLPNGRQEHVASTYVYEAEIGLSQALAAALRQSGAAAIKARRGNVADVYMEAVGRPDISVEVEEAARLLAAMEAVPASYRPKLGEFLWSATDGPCKVVAIVHHPVYQMERKDGSPFHTVIDHHGLWSLMLVQPGLAG